MPLRALLNGEQYWASNLTEYDREGDFCCPICKEKFIPIIPKEHIIKHFRHKSGQEHWEPETPEHLEMKQLTYEIAKRLHWKSTIEMPIDDYIADVFLNKKETDIAIECQCSPLSVPNFFLKDRFYLEHNIFPLWIFGGHWFRRATSFFEHGKWVKQCDNSGLDLAPNEEYHEYKIQRISKLERELDTQSRVIYYYNHWHFYIGTFQRRYHSDVLGWYKLESISMRDLLQGFERLHGFTDDLITHFLTMQGVKQELTDYDNF